MTQQEVLIKLSEEMKLRGFSPTTQASYRLQIKAFQSFHGKPATELGIKEIKQYLYHLTEVKKLKPGTVNFHNSGIRFLYSKVLDIEIKTTQIPRQKKCREIPEIFTREELMRLFDYATIDLLRNLNNWYKLEE